MKEQVIEIIHEALRSLSEAAECIISEVQIMIYQDGDTISYRRTINFKNPNPIAFYPDIESNRFLAPQRQQLVEMFMLQFLKTQSEDIGLEVTAISLLIDLSKSGSQRFTLYKNKGGVMSEVKQLKLEEIFPL